MCIVHVAETCFFPQNKGSETLQILCLFTCHPVFTSSLINIFTLITLSRLGLNDLE